MEPIQSESGRHSLLLGLIVLTLPAPLVAGEPDAGARAALQQSIRRLAADGRLAGARVGVLVSRTDSGRALVKLRHTEPFNIASNVKLVTGAAALSVLGAEHRFQTVICAGKHSGAVVQGDLYLKGHGDPTLQEADLWSMVQDLYDRGIRQVSGGVAIDESAFDRQRDPPLYRSKQTSSHYRPTSGALALGYNVMALRVLGGAAPGDPGKLQLWPRSSHLRVVNKTVTRARGRAWIRVKALGPDRLEVTGKVRSGRRGPMIHRRIEDPGQVAGHALLDLLRIRGIRVADDKVKRAIIKRCRRPLAQHLSAPLALIVRRMNKASDNFVAEQLLKALGASAGRPATWARGLAVVSAYLKGIGLAPGSYVMKNGSGLYDATRFSPGQVVQVLRSARFDFGIGAEFMASLAVGGVDGTLRRRHRRGRARRRVRAKTGTLAGVVTLSGFVGIAGKRQTLSFSILINDLPEGKKKTRAARQVADAMVEAMVDYLDGKRPTTNNKQPSK